MTTETKEREYIIHRRNVKRHEHQREIVESVAKRKIVRAGRRGGKTVVAARMCVEKFLAGLRPLYAAPTSDQLETWWFEVKRALAEPIDAGIYKKNETEHAIELEGTKNRIKGKTAWNADTLRGDYSDFLVLDEFQLMNEDTWEVVGAPMLLDNNGDAMFIYTPPSLRATGVSKARDPRHAAKLFQKANLDTTGRWEAFHFTSHDNPYLDTEALQDITQDMSRDSYLKEILAEEDDSQINLLVYGAFNEMVCKIDRFEIPSSWFVYSGHDFGSANPAALFVAQDQATGFFYCFREYVPPTGKSTYQNVQAFKELSEDYNVMQRVGGSHQEEEIRQGYATQGWPISEPYITKVGVQIDRVKQLMEKNKIFIFSDMYWLLEQINNCMWKLDDMGQPTNEIKDEKRYHILACLRYLCSIFRPETERTDGPGEITVLQPGANIRERRDSIFVR